MKNTNFRDFNSIFAIKKKR